MKQYLDLLRRIKTEGVVRGDRTGTGTKGVFGHQMRFDLSEGFPLLTTKKVFLKGVIHELLWFLRGDTNIKYLVDNGVHIWDNDAYRHYNELCVRHGVLPVGRETFLASAGVEAPIEGYRFGDLNHVYGYQWRSWPRPDGGVVDQIAQAAGLIRTNPESRRIVVSAWNVAEIDAMALPPCHVLFQFYVAGGRLSCQLYQRSADTFLGVPFNIASYALLTRQQARDNAISLLQEAADQSGADAAVANEASEGIQVLAGYTMKEAQIENLVTAKGYTDCVAFMGEDSISVVVDTGTGELTAEDVAKITDIAMTETGYPASGIKIMASN